MTKKNSFSHVMRALHRDIGYLFIGMIILWSVSGIILVYRDTDFLKVEKVVEKKVEKGLTVEDLGRILRIRDFRIISSEGSSIRFETGSYNAVTGEVSYTSKQLPWILEKGVKLHKSMSQDVIHWTNIMFGAMLIFMSVSSFWMYDIKSAKFKRALYFTGGGIVLAILLLAI